MVAEVNVEHILLLKSRILLKTERAAAVMGRLTGNCRDRLGMGSMDLLQLTKIHNLVVSSRRCVRNVSP